MSKADHNTTTLQDEVFVHDKALVEPGAQLGAGTRVWAFAHVLPLRMPRLLSDPLFAWTARSMALRVQDRVIAFEETVRLTDTVGEDIRHRVHELSASELIALRFCDNAEVDEITLQGEVRRIFTGWMFASSPGLHAVEHPIYDVWLTDCKGGEATTVAGTKPPTGPAPAPPPPLRR